MTLAIDLPVTIMLAAFYTVMLAWLALAVIRQRRANEVALLDHGITAVQYAVRAHGNFTEYAPLSITLVLVAELSGASPYVIAPIATLLALGRVSHAYSLLVVEQRSATPSFAFRIRGMQMTLFGLIALAALLIWLLLESIFFVS